MAPIRMLVVAPLTVLVGGCGLVEADPHRFERWAQSVAEIDVSAEDAGLRGMIGPEHEIVGPRTPMTIHVVEPEVLWDARADGFQDGLRGPIQATLEAGAQAVVQQAAAQVAETVVEAVREGLTVQLGAFSSRAAAEAAWARMSDHAGLDGAEARFEPVTRQGQTLFRLRAGPVSPDAVGAVCRAAGAGDWCASTARS